MKKRFLYQPNTPRSTASRSGQYCLWLILLGLVACSHHTQPVGTGPQKRMQLAVGEINEVSLARPADTTLQLTGVSDNSEVVDVSRKQLASQPTVLAQETGPLIFLVKGVTVGTARVVFSEKRPTGPGEGTVRKTYVVQVTNK